MFNIFKKFIYIERKAGIPNGIIHFCGLKIKWHPDQTWIADIISQQVAREVYSALDVQSLHSKVFPKFKNINKDKDVLIFGCGPTIEYFNNEVDGEKIALNKAILLDNIDFQYSFCIDNALLQTCPNYLDIIKNPKYVSFVGKHLHPERIQMPELTFGEENNVYRFYVGTRHSMPAKSYQEWLYPNIENHPLADFRSVSFSALHFALYTHPKRIYLIGLDTANTINYFDKFGRYNIKVMKDGYERFKRFAEVYYPDVEIISVNPVGLKGMFKDVYTPKYAAEHPEIKESEILKI